jgi:hypothetical protein
LGGFAVLLDLPRNRLALNAFCMHFDFHNDNPTRSAENQKTYRRLFGMIFFGGSEWMLVATLQQLATQKISKNRKNTKANSFFISRNIDLPAKTPQKRPAFMPVLRFDALFSLLICCGRVNCIDI